jgi:hypothetical protein
MQRNSAGNNPLRRRAVWRGLVGCVVAYALVITALLSAVIQSEWVAQAAAGLVGEHCATDARAAGMDPAGPAGQPHESSHCALCTLAAGPVVLPVSPSARAVVLPGAGAPAAGSDRELIHSLGHPSKLPRGPPPAGVEA